MSNFLFRTYLILNDFQNLQLNKAICRSYFNGILIVVFFVSYQKDSCIRGQLKYVLILLKPKIADIIFKP